MQGPDAQLVVHKPYATVQDLPHELVADILSIIALGPASDMARSTDWLRLRLVCRDWHTIACSTAGLWADIRAYPKVRIEWLRLCLERSAAAPLALLLVMLPEETYGELLPMLSRPENSRRIRVLRIRFDDVPRAVLALCSLAMPSLEQLETIRESFLPHWIVQPIWLPDKEHLVSPSSPRLHTLRLAGMAFPKNPAFYAALRSLTIREQCCSHHLLSLTDLAAVLRATRRLEALNLSHFEPCDLTMGNSDSDRPIADVPVYLPHLRNYTVHSIVPVLSRVNRILAFPPTCTMVLSIRAAPWGRPVVGPVYTSTHAALADVLAPSIRLALQDAVTMTVSCGDGQFAIRIPEPGATVSGLTADPAPESESESDAPPRARVSVWMQVNIPPPAFGAFVPFCPSDRLTSLTFGRVKDTYPAAKWAAVFRAYPTLQRITLAEAQRDVSSVFAALTPSAQPRGRREEGEDEHGEDGTRPAQEVLCPALRHIEVRLRMRTSKGLSRLAGSLVRCAAPRAEGLGGARRLESLTVIWEHRREGALPRSDPEWEGVVGKLRVLIDEVEISARKSRHNSRLDFSRQRILAAVHVQLDREMQQSWESRAQPRSAQLRNVEYVDARGVVEDPLLFQCND
ncbi:hypothetical protein C8Q80DRAFT_1117031 [Daedaleopsis nitida]|nr:hypothetical protein C8Q80DRAFT_1117031 [Daedaleopsis nitida]